jgi:hypothetical protein
MRVRSHVVEDIVPFAELSAAALEVTKEDLSPSIALQIEVLNKCKRSKIRDEEARIKPA